MANSSLKMRCEKQRDHKHAQTAHKAGASMPVRNPQTETKTVFKNQTRQQ
jgi:hypothetical protein